MKKSIPQTVINAFTNYEPDLPDHAAGEIRVESLSGGLINHSYKICCELKPDFLLQQINKKVFHRPEQVQENYINIWQYAEFEFTGLKLPSPKYCGRLTTLFVDEKENYWRAFEFISDSKMQEIAQKPAQAKATAMAFAKFTTSFDDFNVELLKKVIPGFHDLSLRYRQFEESLNSEQYERMAKSLPLIQELKQRERYKHFYEVITESAEFPLRVMHHDAKIANVLFHAKTGKVICVVDFDTVMPGYYFSDLGDMIRSMACSHDENSTNPDELHIRKNFYDAILSGYLEVMNMYLTASEKKYIHYAGILMTYMQALRFITDYLNDDLYYKTNYPGQNFDRANNQLTLLKKLELFLKEEYSLTL